MENALAIGIIKSRMELAKRDFAVNGPLSDLMTGVYIGTIQSYADQAGTMEASALANKCRFELLELNKPVENKPVEDDAERAAAGVSA